MKNISNEEDNMFNRPYPNAERPFTEDHKHLRMQQVAQMRQQYQQSYTGPTLGGIPMPTPVFRQRAIDPAHRYTLPILFVPSAQTPGFYSNHIAFNVGAHDDRELQRLGYTPSPMPRA